MVPAAGTGAPGLLETSSKGRGKTSTLLTKYIRGRAAPFAQRPENVEPGGGVPAALAPRPAPLGGVSSARALEKYNLLKFSFCQRSFLLSL